MRHDYLVGFQSDGWDSYADERLAGLWRAFSHESERTETAWEGGTSFLSRKTTYEYDAYGNLALTSENDERGALLRRTTHSYAVRNDSSYYIVDRKLEDNVFNGAGQWLAKTVYGYDGSLGGPPNLTAGNLTLVRKYHNLQSSTALPASALSSDTSYGYDSYGNQTTVTTYAGSGTLTNGTAFSSPGGGSAGSTTTTAYDSLFPALPVQVDTPPNQWNVRLTQRATYDYRLGAILHLTDPNGQTTTVSCYDVFGSMRHLTRPGDGYDAPTAWFEHYDWEYPGYGRPVKYLVGRREIGFDHGAWQATLAYYDGLGREIQTKVESGNGTQHIVTDKLYDGLGQVTAASQPRYVNQSGDSFWQYAPLLAESDPGYQQVHRWTRTTYDGLGRPRTITAPDGSPTDLTYSIVNSRRAVRTTDAGGHNTRRESDLFGRLAYVAEYDGAGNFYSGTSYSYNPLDLLERVTDGNGKITSMTYDSLGRKLSTSDPTMGSWSYGYDANGNLRTQADARGQVISFNYDGLNRLINKSLHDGSKVSYFYDEAGAVNGKGQRTRVERVTASNALLARTTYGYTNRGQLGEATVYVTGFTGIPNTRRTLWSYDSGERLTSMTNPNNEVVT